jgi:hypothetical protein
VRSPLYTNDGKTAAGGPQQIPSPAPAGYRERRWKKTKKRKKGVTVGIVEEDGKKTIPYSFNPPVQLQFRNGADNGYSRRARRTGSRRSRRG